MKIYLFLLCFFVINIAISQTSSSNRKNKPSLKNTTDISLNTPSCDELIHYRDIGLVKQFDDFIKEYSKKYKQANDGLENMQEIKLQLLKERGWDELMSTGTAMSEVGVTTAQIARIIKTNCDLILDLAEMMPGENVAVTVIKEAKLTAEKTYEIIKKGKDLKEIVEGNLELVADKNVLETMSLGGKGMKTALDFAQNIDELIKIPEEREQLKSDVERILNMLDNLVYKYQEDLKKNKEKMDERIQIVNGITKYLVEHHCSVKSFKKVNKQLLKKELDKNKNTQVRVHDKKTTGNPFYIFLTCNISPSVTIISSPILHNGLLTDDLTDDKKDFAKQVEMQFPNAPKDFKENLLKTNYESIAVHFDKPFDTNLLKSTKDALAAIESYKQSMRDAISGLEGADPIDFFQLK